MLFLQFHYLLGMNDGYTKEEIKMEISIGSRFKHAWNAFLNRDPPKSSYYGYGGGYGYRPYYSRFGTYGDKTIVTAVYSRIAIDASSITIQHVKLDKNDRFSEVIDSDLNSCLNLSANVDQTGRAFIQDIVMSMLDEGVIAVVPTRTNVDPRFNESYKIGALRVGKIVNWYPHDVTVDLYNEDTCQHEQLTFPKRMVAIIENPFYSVMNEPNSTMQRLIRKLNLMDVVDEQIGSGKLDLIIQLPYVVKSQARREQAEKRRSEIEDQLSGSKYGIAYTDGTEKITQLNRSLENNLLKQVEYLTEMVYSQLSITKEIMNGTADEQAMTNFYNRTIEPILAAIVDEFKRKFLTKTARSQKQSIMFFRNPFKLVPVGTLAELTDKFTRNEVMTSNEIRQVIGLKPSTNPEADELRNKNLNPTSNTISKEVETSKEGDTKNQNGTV